MKQRSHGRPRPQSQEVRSAAADLGCAWPSSAGKRPHLPPHLRSHGHRNPQEPSTGRHRLLHRCGRLQGPSKQLFRVSERPYCRQPTVWAAETDRSSTKLQSRLQVEARDLGNNFLLNAASLGCSRAQSTTNLLQVGAQKGQSAICAVHHVGSQLSNVSQPSLCRLADCLCCKTYPCGHFRANSITHWGRLAMLLGTMTGMSRPVSPSPMLSRILGVHLITADPLWAAPCLPMPVRFSVLAALGLFWG